MFPKILMFSRVLWHLSIYTIGVCKVILFQNLNLNYSCRKQFMRSTSIWFGQRLWMTMLGTLHQSPASTFPRGRGLPQLLIRNHLQRPLSHLVLGGWGRGRGLLLVSLVDLRRRGPGKGQRWRRREPWVVFRLVFFLGIIVFLFLDCQLYVCSIYWFWRPL